MSEIPKLKHCVLKVHYDGTCGCTLKSPDNSGRAIGSTNEVVVIDENTGQTISRAPVGPKNLENVTEVEPVPPPMDAPGQKIALKVMPWSPFKFICVECNTMIDVTDSMLTTRCKCGHEFAIMVKKAK